MTRPLVEVADILRSLGPSLREGLCRDQHRAVSAIESCRTAVLGGHVSRCEDCARIDVAYNVRHDLIEVVFIALSAVLCGAEDCTDMADLAHARQDWLGSILDLPHGVPSHDTFSRVFRMLEPAASEAAFARFAAGFTRKLKGVVAIDGKALRGAYRRGSRASPLHLVNIWANETRMAIAATLAPNRNEIAGALEALALISLEGCIVTADALYCRPDIASAITGRGGDYVIALKANQPLVLSLAERRLDPSGVTLSAVSGPILAHGRTERDPPERS